MLASVVVLAFPTTFGANTTVKAAIDTTPQSKGVTWVVSQKWKLADGTYNWAGIESDLVDIKNANINWVRIPAERDITFMTQLLLLADQYSINILATITGTPAKDIGTESDRAEYRTWLTAYVNMFKNQIRYWEAGNEPNGPGYWTIDITDTSDQRLYEQSVQNYILRLKDTYETIKANDPSAQVMIGGIAEWKFERWIDAFIKLQGYQYMDIMAFHPYRRYPDEVLARLLSLKSKMSQVEALNSKPIWITEIGFHTSRQANSGMYVPNEHLRAEYLRQTLQKLRDNGVVMPIFWYTFNEPSSTYAGFGLVVKDITTLATQYLPSYYALKDFWTTQFLSIHFTTDDASVTSAAPTINYGTTESMATASSPKKNAYMKFDLSALDAYNVSDVKLKIHTTSTNRAGSTALQNIYLADANWSQSTIHYDNRPLSTTLLATVAAPDVFEWYDVTIPSDTIQSQIPGYASFEVRSDSFTNDDLLLTTKETPERVNPQLMVYYKIIPAERTLWTLWLPNIFQLEAQDSRTQSLSRFPPSPWHEDRCPSAGRGGAGGAGMIYLQGFC